MIEMKCDKCKGLISKKASAATMWLLVAPTSSNSHMDVGTSTQYMNGRIVARQDVCENCCPTIFGKNWRYESLLKPQEDVDKIIEGLEGLIDSKCLE
jgi:hypothetical protein